MRKVFIPPVLVVLSLMLIIICSFGFTQLRLVIFPFNLTGLLIGFAGIVIMRKAHNLFRRYKTTETFAKSTHLICEGVFRCSRNPMYCGMFLFLLGTAICTGNISAIFVPFIFMGIIRIFFIPIEERKMEETFGRYYLEYKKSTRMWVG